MTKFGKEKREQMKNNIISESKKLFFSKGYDKTTTSEIATKVGIAEGTVFNYFKTKSEIFLAVFANEFSMEEIDINEFIDIKFSVSDVLFDFLNKTLNSLFLLPKSLLRELGYATLNIMKKSSFITRKFADIDYKLMELLDELIQEMQEKGLIKDCDARLLAETIYGVMIFEFFIYLYEDKKTKDDVLDSTRKKIEIVINGYV